MWRPISFHIISTGLRGSISHGDFSMMGSVFIGFMNPAGAI